MLEVTPAVLLEETPTGTLETIRGAMMTQSKPPVVTLVVVPVVVPAEM